MSSNDVGSPRTFTVNYFTVTRTFNFKQDYDNKGKITTNILGEYKYADASKPFQNTSVTVSPSAKQYYTNRSLQNISYNAFKCPIEINEENIDRISFDYSFTQERNAMFYGNTDIDKLTRPYRKYYSGDGSMEVKYTVATDEVEFITYIGGDAYSSNIVYKTDGVTTPNYLGYFYLHRDYQGSILAITNGAGEILEKRVFDPWGSIVSVQDGAGNNLSQLTFFDRGYTGHEHLESVGLINMNARLYDPKLHRFLSPDNYIQDPYNTQNYNRYGYCWNNPLKYTDPTGDEFVSAMLIGAGIGLAAYLTMSAMNDAPITLKGALMATFIGAVSGVVTCGIGDAVAHTANFALKSSLQALMHGAFQGTLSGITGGGFWAGAAAGALSSIASSVWKGDLKTETGFFKENNWAYGSRVTGSFAGVGGGGTAGMIAFGTVMGGAGAALTGGNFWQGAVTGLVVSGLNHAMHQMSDDGDIDPPSKKKGATTKSNSSKIKTAFDDNIDAINNSMTGSGAYADALESYSHTNSKFIYKYGTKTASALELSRANKVFQLKVARGANIGGKLIGGAGLGLTVYQRMDGQITNTEFFVDSAFGVIGFMGPVGAGVSLVYFGGKAAYEYYSGNTLFTKPK